MMRKILLIVTAAIVLQFCFLQTSAIEIKAALYNSIPDLADDALLSYKEFVEWNFKNYVDDLHTVKAFVSEKEYDPYAGINKFKTEYVYEFDLMEIDTATLAELVDWNLVMKIADAHVSDTMLPAAVEAVKIKGDTYGYPTLVCGNFLIGLNPASDRVCPLKSAKDDYIDLFKILNECYKKVIIPSYPYHERLLGGKMNDDYGWYLPFIYLDGYIDQHGPFSIAKAVLDLEQGIVDEELCDRLNWFYGWCSFENSNKCYDKYADGNYINNKEQVYLDIVTDKTLFFYGFSEKLSEVIRESEGQKDSYAIISPPFGKERYLLQFTDALVISKVRWEAANMQKRYAILAFVRYFTSTNFRHKFVMGQDLNPQRTRFLLPPNKDFYTKTDAKYNYLYQDLYWALKRAVPAPRLSSSIMSKIQDVLSAKCIKI